MNNMTTEKKTGEMRGNKRGSERGIALVIALVMLVLLGILGAMVLSTSTTDLRIAGNYRNGQEAFYAADAAISFCTTFDMLQTAFLGMGAMNGKTFPVADFLVGDNTANATIAYIKKVPLPKGAGYNAVLGDDQPCGLYYSVTATGRGHNNAEKMLEAGVVQVVPSSGPEGSCDE